LPSNALTLEARARQSLGSSHDAIYHMVDRALSARGIAGGRLVDVGCGSAGLWRLLAYRFASYCGLDAVRYQGFPTDAEFHLIDLDALDNPAGAPVAPREADVVAAVETIEHLENPWAFMRALVELVRPGGWVVVTTPNQLSALSLATLVIKRRFSAFQDTHYPAHRTALLEVDLRRAAGECGLRPVDVLYSHAGRVPLTSWHFPAALARSFPRALSDNLLIIGRKPDRGGSDRP
jgi:2-polyprenyl-3-methyl-5-hydroxy-6-metoxy-1,4-benzoquinol methylase